MSKSRGNTVSPDELIESMGADTERVYTLFLGPPEEEVEWRDEAVAGAWRFLNRVWRIAEKLEQAPPTGPADEELVRLRHHTVKRVSEDFERFKFNTVVAAMMELSSGLQRALDEATASRMACEEAFDALLQLLHPIAPHITEELWERRGHPELLLESSWPAWDPNKLIREQVTLVVQVDGKLRDRIEVPADSGKGELEAAALASDRVQSHLAGRKLVRAVVIPGRLVNLVTTEVSA
jgi:leucyl-tRNA synthetase